MHIVFAHNFYQQAGGEDAVVAQEMDLLRSAGHKVSLYEKHNDEIKGLWPKMEVAFSTVYSKKSRNNFEKYLESRSPDVVHVHNFFPLLTPSIYDACRALDIPVVQTLHNFRITCAGGLLMRDGAVCELCINRSPYQAVKYRCYRESVFGSTVLAHMISTHRKKQTWSNKVDRIIALTDFSRSKYVAAGVAAKKIVVKPNFINDPFSGGTIEFPASRNGALYVGRLSAEKGIDVLISAWKHIDEPLRIVGDGPLRTLVEDCGLDNVHYLGKLPHDKVSEEMMRASFLVMPSIWYEGFPMVLVEAFAHGLPVVASNIGNLAEIIDDKETGFLFEAGNSGALYAVVNSMLEDSAMLPASQALARETFVKKYAPETNLKLLLEIYRGVM